MADVIYTNVLFMPLINFYYDGNDVFIVSFISIIIGIIFGIVPCFKTHNEFTDQKVRKKKVLIYYTLFLFFLCFAAFFILKTYNVQEFSFPQSMTLRSGNEIFHFEEPRPRTNNTYFQYDMIICGAKFANYKKTRASFTISRYTCSYAFDVKIEFLSMNPDSTKIFVGKFKYSVDSNNEVEYFLDCPGLSKEIMRN